MLLFFLFFYSGFEENVDTEGRVVVECEVLKVEVASFFLILL